MQINNKRIKVIKEIKEIIINKRINKIINKRINKNKTIN